MVLLRYSLAPLFITAATMLTLASAPAFSDDGSAGDEASLSAPNWRLVDIGYTIEKDRDSNAQADLLNLRASLPVYQYGLLQFESKNGEISHRVGNGSMNAYQVNIMGGLRTAASEHADLFLLVGATRVEMETDSSNLSEHGFITQTGMRGRINERLDVASYIQYSKTGGVSTTSWHGDVRYNILNRVDLLVGGGIYSRAWSGKIGVSVHF